MSMTLVQMSGSTLETTQAELSAEFRIYLTFSLSGPSFAIPAGAMIEIVPCSSIDESDDKPSFVRGLVQYKNGVLPIVDLSKRYSTHATAIGPYTCVLVLAIGQLQLGVLVDEVQGLAAFSAQDLMPVPELAMHTLNVDIVDGLVKDEHEWLIVLGVERLLTDCEAEELAAYMQPYQR